MVVGEKKMRQDMVRKLLIPAGAAVLGVSLLAGVYFGLVSWAEGPQHALNQFRGEALYVVPILLGFGLQSALFVILRWRLYLPSAAPGASSALTGAGGGTSAAAMVACCAHHVTDVLPILGLTAATSFLAQYQQAFMLLGLLTTLGGSAYMLRLLIKERNKIHSTGAAALEVLS
jgi:hypothetical protein